MNKPEYRGSIFERLSKSLSVKVTLSFSLSLSGFFQLLLSLSKYDGCSQIGEGERYVSSTVVLSVIGLCSRIGVTRWQFEITGLSIGLDWKLDRLVINSLISIFDMGKGREKGGRCCFW